MKPYIRRATLVEEACGIIPQNLYKTYNLEVLSVLQNEDYHLLGAIL